MYVVSSSPSPARAVAPSSLGLAVALLLAAASLLAPAPADACGGFFCGQQPVEQNAERILFEVNDDSVTAVIEITYSGSSDDFSWILPLSGELVGELELVPSGVLGLLELATVPRIRPPPTKCSRPDPPLGPFGAMNDVALRAGGEGGVDVTELPRVGPFEPVLVRSDDPTELVRWLNDNGYTVTTPMEPFIDGYVAQDFRFLAMKLAPDAGVSDIAPVQVTYQGTEPMVPLMLTSVATGPETGIVVFIVGNQRFEARNYTNLQVDVDDLQADPINGQNNYYPLVSWMIDDAGGRAFVTEYSGGTQDTLDSVQNLFFATEDGEESAAWLQNLLRRSSAVTRLYSRMGGWEMTADPSFQVSAGGAVGRDLDLSDRPEVEVCAPGTEGDDRIVPCGSTYCGVGAVCATTTEGIDGCVCGDGWTARAIRAPMGPGFALVDTVTCQQADFEFLADVVGTDNGPADPCIADTCGANGSCAQINGFPTCTCDDGFAAIPNGVGGTTCVEAVTTYDADQLLWPTGCSGCSSAGGDPEPVPPGALALLAALLPVALRRTHRTAGPRT